MNGMHSNRSANLGSLGTDGTWVTLEAVNTLQTEVRIKKNDERHDDCTPYLVSVGTVNTVGSWGSVDSVGA